MQKVQNRLETRPPHPGQAAHAPQCRARQQAAQAGPAGQGLAGEWASGEQQARGCPPEAGYGKAQGWSQRAPPHVLASQPHHGRYQAGPEMPAKPAQRLSRVRPGRRTGNTRGDGEMQKEGAAGQERHLQTSGFCAPGRGQQREPGGDGGQGRWSDPRSPDAGSDGPRGLGGGGPTTGHISFPPPRARGISSSREGHCPLGG